MRLDDLISLSRRSLFGRVVRLPSLFPFKRQEAEAEGRDKKSGGKLSQPTHQPDSGPSSYRDKIRQRRKRRKESDRQMISINGKQYYVDDDGELKGLKEDNPR